MRTQCKQFLFYTEKYSKYDDRFRYEVAVWTEKHGQRQAAKKYFIEKSLVVKTKALRQEKCRKRTMLSVEIDEKVLKMIRNMRNAGVVINFHIVVGFAAGIVLANDRTLLKENGGTVEFTVG